MKNKTKKLTYLVSSIVIFIVAFALMVVATVKASAYGKKEYSHNIKIVSIQEEPSASSSIIYYIISVEGDIVNNTKDDKKLVGVTLVLEGVDNKTGRKSTCESIFVIEELKSNTKYDVSAEKFKVGNMEGFIPESVKEVKLMIENEVIDVEFEEVDDSNLIIFAISFALLFVSFLPFAMWNNLRKKEINNETIK